MLNPIFKLRPVSGFLLFMLLVSFQSSSKQIIVVISILPFPEGLFVGLCFTLCFLDLFFLLIGGSEVVLIGLQAVVVVS